MTKDCGRPHPQQYCVCDRCLDALHIEKMERDSDGFWIYLKRGWKVNGEHAIVEDTKRAAYAKLSSVVPCQCEECKQ